MFRDFCKIKKGKKLKNDNKIEENDLNSFILNQNKKQDDNSKVFNALNELKICQPVKIKQNI